MTDDRTPADDRPAQADLPGRPAVRSLPDRLPEENPGDASANAGEAGLSTVSGAHVAGAAVDAARLVAAGVGGSAGGGVGAEGGAGAGLGVGAGAAEVVELAGGVANRVFRVGSEFIVRVPRAEEFVADLRKEVAVVPVARRSGVRTPAIVTAGVVEGHGGARSTPYVVMERVEGNDLADGHAGPAVWQELGRQIALLHRTPRQTLDGVPEDGDDRGTAVDEVVARGYLDGGTGQWLRSWLDELSGRFDHDAPKVLLHGDLGRQNVMVRDGRFEALIDWGDAAWGPRAMEFAKLRLEEVAHLLPSYRSAAELSVAPGELEAEVLWFHLTWGVSNLLGPPRPGQRHWTAPPVSRLLGVLRFLTSSPPEPWPGLIKKVDLWH